MLGSPDNPGVLPCTLRDVFMQIDLQSELTNIWVSYLEIYNENIHDLLCPQQQNLKI